MPGLGFRSPVFLYVVGRVVEPLWHKVDQARLSNFFMQKLLLACKVVLHLDCLVQSIGEAFGSERGVNGMRGAFIIKRADNGDDPVGRIGE